MESGRADVAAMIETYRFQGFADLQSLQFNTRNDSGALIIKRALAVARGDPDIVTTEYPPPYVMTRVVKRKPDPAAGHSGSEGDVAENDEPEPPVDEGDPTTNTIAQDASDAIVAARIAQRAADIAMDIVPDSPGPTLAIRPLVDTEEPEAPSTALPIRSPVTQPTVCQRCGIFGPLSAAANGFCSRACASPPPSPDEKANNDDGCRQCGTFSSSSTAPPGFCSDRCAAKTSESTPEPPISTFVLMADDGRRFDATDKHPGWLCGAEWANMFRCATETWWWLKNWRKLDVKTITLLTRGVIEIEFTQTWNKAEETDALLICRYYDQQRLVDRLRRAKRGRRPQKKVHCNWCDELVPKSDIHQHCDDTHPNRLTADGILGEEEELEDDDPSVVQFVAVVKVSIWRRYSRYKSIEIDTVFKIWVGKVTFVNVFLGPRTAHPSRRVDRAVIGDNDVITVAFPNPAALNPLLGPGWHFRRWIDESGHQLLSMVLFGTQVVVCGDSEYQKEHAIHFRHTTERHLIAPGATGVEQVVETGIVEVSYVKARSNLLPAV